MTVRTLSGKVVFTKLMHHPVDLSTCQLVGLMDITTHFAVPFRCARINWNLLDLGTTICCNGILVWQTLQSVDSMQGPVELEEEDAVCFICESPCDDEDDTDSRHFACVRCMPCFLCERCKTHLPTAAFDASTQNSIHSLNDSDLSDRAEWPVCFFCLEEADVPMLRNVSMSAMQRFRLGLLNEEVALLL